MTFNLCRRSFALSAVLFLSPLNGNAADTVQVSDGVTLIAIRHADRSGAQANLNPTGVARAAALPAALSGHQIDAIFAPSITRNLDTAAPLATARGIDIQSIATFGMPDILATLAIDQTVLWVGNKDNLRRLWTRTGAPGEPPLKYGDLFIVRFSADAAPTVTHQRFGELHPRPNPGHEIRCRCPKGLSQMSYFKTKLQFATLVTLGLSGCVAIGSRPDFSGHLGRGS